MKSSILSRKQLLVRNKLRLDPQKAKEKLIQSINPEWKDMFDEISKW
jgi:hypothetical protein